MDGCPKMLMKVVSETQADANITLTKLKKATCSGLSAISHSITNAIREKWEKLKLKHSCPILPFKIKSPLQLKIKPLMQSYLFTGMS